MEYTHTEYPPEQTDATEDGTDSNSPNEQERQITPLTEASLNEDNPETAMAIYELRSRESSALSSRLSARAELTGMAGWPASAPRAGTPPRPGSAGVLMPPPFTPPFASPRTGGQQVRSSCVCVCVCARMGVCVL